MQALRQQLLASAARPQQQDGNLRARHPLDRAGDLHHFGRGADQAAQHPPVIRRGVG